VPHLQLEGGGPEGEPSPSDAAVASGVAPGRVPADRTERQQAEPTTKDQRERP
jgi:hypothetical protein